MNWHIPKRFTKSELSKIKTLTEDHQKLVSLWIEKPCPFLIIHGKTTESGQAELASAIYNRLELGCKRYAKEFDFYSYLKVEDGSPEVRLNYILEADLLVIDEWLSYASTEWQLRIMKHLVSKRLDDMKLTIFCTCLDMVGVCEMLEQYAAKFANGRALGVFTHG